MHNAVGNHAAVYNSNIGGGNGCVRSKLVRIFFERGCFEVLSSLMTKGASATDGAFDGATPLLMFNEYAVLIEALVSLVLCGDICNILL